MRQRVSQGPDEPPHRAARHARIGVERDHVAHAWRSLAAGGVRRIGGAPQQAVELVELAALALPTHVDVLGSVESPLAPKDSKAITAARRPSVPKVKACDAGLRHGEDLGVIFELRLGSVQEVGQEREVKIAVVVGEEVHLEPLDQALDLCRIGEQHGHGDQRAQRRRNTVLERQLGQRPRRQQGREKALQESDRGLRSRPGGEHCQTEPRQRRRNGRSRDLPEEGQEAGGQNRRGAEVSRQAGSPHGSRQPLPRTRAETQAGLELGSQFSEQEGADGCAWTLGGQSERALGDRSLGRAAARASSSTAWRGVPGGEELCQ